MKPKRIQLSRKKGFKLPPNTVIVARPTRWGNPFAIGRDGTRQECLYRYKKFVHGNVWSFPNKQIIKDELKGKNLACWCKIGEPCHADVLLEIANPP